ncbi:type IV toxin-antitoxin system AbiEi family antitoxin [Microbacterium sp. LMI1-1-1.1]|uniref:type IV toxin-antitoxin system AbiEi family antitoxin n=1 Tax=Microbacterium sp. LMI1-1-1.1 TaxID=3135223 RepID=UPI003466F928
MASPFLFFPGDPLTESELRAACLDGLLVPLGAGFMHADAAETAWMRAASLRPLLGDALAATRLTAAWIHGALDVEPVRHEVQRAVPRRSTDARRLSVAYRDMQIDDGDLETVAGVRVTSVARTLADLARSEDPVHLEAASRWRDGDRAAVIRAREWLAGARRFPGKRRAAALLGEASS